MTDTTTKDPRFKNKPRFGCSGCCEDFTSLSTFDQHRVGTYTPLGRRCRTAKEMTKRGWQQDENDRWYDPTSRARVKEAFA